MRDLRAAEFVEDFLKRHVFAFVRDDFRARGELRPRAWIIGQNDPDTGRPLDDIAITYVVCPDFRGSTDEKDKLAAMLKVVSIRMKAIGVIFVSEVWVSEQITREEYEEHRRPGGKRIDLEKFPDSRRQEALYLSLDHIAFPKTRAFRAMIKRDAEGKPTLGEFSELPTTGQEGRFTNLFPRELWQ